MSTQASSTSSASNCTIEIIDHLEVFVPDRYQAAEWYRAVLGLEIMHGHVWDWAVNLPNGPLFVANLTGSVKVSLFEGEPLRGRPPIGLTRAAFRMDGEMFLRFLDRLNELELFNDDGERVTPRHLADHKAIWAVYFNDPYGNRYEVNTYDYDMVKQRRPDLIAAATSPQP